MVERNVGIWSKLIPRLVTTTTCGACLRIMLTTHSTVFVTTSAAPPSVSKIWRCSDDSENQSPK
jgi:hypothetical protein